MSFTEKEKEIFNKALKIYREEEKSMNKFYERIEKELEVSMEKYKIKYRYLINIIFLIIQVYFLNKQINQSKEFKAINKELDDLYKNFEEMQ